MLLDGGDVMKKLIVCILFLSSCGQVPASSYDLEKFFNYQTKIFQFDCQYTIERDDDKIILYQSGGQTHIYANIEIEKELFNGQEVDLIRFGYIKVFKTDNQWIMYSTSFNCFEEI